LKSSNGSDTFPDIMNRGSSETGPVVYTVGHSNHDIEVFTGLVKDNGIESLVDVRSSPYSKYSAHFNKDKLEAYLGRQGIKYEYMGDRLGGMPSDESFYDGSGHVLYSRIAESEEFKEGVARLLEKIAQSRVALMCGEENPDECHRRLLIGRVLFERGVKVAHIRGDGRVQTEDELRREEENQNRQLSLFGDEGEDEWKSTRSVSQKKAQKNSSES
jgi:uncharacterized protein (DUF488 family)